MKLSSRSGPLSPSCSAFAGFRFPTEVIVLAVRWRSCWSSAASRSTTSLSTGGCRGFTPLFADAARFARHAPGERWFVDETYVKVNGVWRYVYRAVDRHGQVIDLLVSKRRAGHPAEQVGSYLTGLRPSPTRRVVWVAARRGAPVAG